jgi:acetyl esterase/lipase
VVSPDYRLRPEAEPLEIIQDIKDFWAWLNTSLPGLSYANVDLCNISLCGESAGGWLAAQSVELGWAQNVKALMLQYPAGLDPGANPYSLKAFFATGQRMPLSIIEEHLAGVPEGSIVTRTPFGTRMHLAMCMMQNGIFTPTGDESQQMDPLKNLETMAVMPPVMLFHGKQDMHVSWESSRNWADRLRTLKPDTPLCCVFRQGEHVMDREVGLQTPWMREPVAFVERYWPGIIDDDDDDDYLDGF